MKIAHVICTFPPYRGGMGNSAYHFARVVSELGHSVTVFTPDYGQKIENESAGNINVIRLKPLIKSGNAAFIPQLLWKMKEYDIIHYHYPFYGANFSIILNKILHRKKLIVHYHMDNVGKGLKGSIFNLHLKFILPIVFMLSDQITCASLDYVKNSSIKNLYERYKPKFKQILFGVDIEKFKPEVKQEGQTKKMLFVGGLDKAHYFKGLENLLAATAVILKKLPDLDLQLDIVGNGDLRDYYISKAKELGIIDKVNFAEKVNDQSLIKYYQDCDIFVLPSINQGEAFGLVLLEAMSCGKPVIASNLPGVRNVFRNEIEGLLVWPDNKEDLAAKIETLLTDNELSVKMGKAARKLTEEQYDWKEIGKKLDQLYHKVYYSPK